LSGSAEILQEYLVRLGFVTDAIGVKKMDGALGAISKKALGVGSAVMGMAVTAEAAIGIFSSQMEKMYYASKLSGSSITNLKSLGQAGKSVGVMGDQIGDAVHNMAAAIRLNPGMQQLIESFGVKVTGRDVSDVAIDTMKALSRQPEWLGAQWANQLFGMDADTYHLLVATPGALDKVGDAQKNLKAMYAAYGLDWEEEGKRAVEYNTQLRVLENRFETLGAVMMKDLQPAFQWLNGALTTGLDSLTKFLSTKDDVVKKGDKLIPIGKDGGVIVNGKFRPNSVTPKHQDPDYRRHIDYGKRTTDWMKSLYPYFHSDAATAEWRKKNGGAAPARIGPAPARVSASNTLEDIDKQYGFPSGTMRSMMRVESTGNPNAISPKGAKGRFQVMPATASSPGFGLSGWNQLDTTNNQDASHSAAYLAALVKKHGSLGLALAAYNGGTGNVDKYHGMPPFKETQDYVANVLGGLDNTKLGAAAGGGNTVTIHQENNFNIAGTDSQSTSRSIEAGLGRMNADLTRGFKGAVQ
jgi:hypothetical protein